PSHDTSTGFFNLTVSLRTTSTDVQCTPGSVAVAQPTDRKSTRLNSSHGSNTYAVCCLKFSNDSPLIFAVTPCTPATTNDPDPTAPAICSFTYPTTANRNLHPYPTRRSSDLPSHDTSTGFFNLTVSLRTTSTTVNCTPGSVAVAQP